MINKIKQGDTSAREKLIKHNIRLVLREVCNKFSNVKYDKKDLVSEGIIGLMKAANTFDISKNVEFSTYAIRCIDNEILMFLRKNKKDGNVDSLDRIISNNTTDDEFRVGDTLADDVDILEECVNNETYQIIRKIVNELPERDRKMIIMHFGFFNSKNYTQPELAEKFNLSQSYVSKLINRSLKRLALELETYGIDEIEERRSK